MNVAHLCASVPWHIIEQLSINFTDGIGSSVRCRICFATVMQKDMGLESQMILYTTSLCLIACVHNLTDSLIDFINLGFFLGILVNS